METRADLDKESSDTPRSKSREKIAVVRAIESFVDTITIIIIMLLLIFIKLLP